MKPFRVLIALMLLFALETGLQGQIYVTVESSAPISTDSIQEALRALYRIPIDKRPKRTAVRTVIESPLFALNPNTGELELKIYGTSISGPYERIETGDMSLGLVIYGFKYGTLYDADGKPECPIYVARVYERLGEYYIQVDCAGQNILTTGNPSLAQLQPFEAWKKYLL